LGVAEDFVAPNRQEIGIESVVEVTEGRVTCVVRCHGGTIMPGDEFRLAVLEGQGRTLSLSVHRIWRYDRLVDLLDAPHTAKIEFVGQYSGEISDLADRGRARLYPA
jgi:hypothetical protein